MTDLKYNKDKGKELYKQITSISNFDRTEDDFLNRLQDEEYAKKVYGVFKDDNLLGAKDENSFLDSLGFKNAAVSQNTDNATAKQSKMETSKVEQTQNPVQSTNPMDSLKIEIPDSINTEIPKVKYEAPETPNMQLNMPFSDKKETQSLGFEQPISIMDIVGETPQERIQAEINSLGGDALVDVARTDAIKADIEQEIRNLNKANESFLKEYESKMSDTKVNDINLHHDSWGYANPFGYKKRKEEKEKSEQTNKFISDNAERYRKIQAKKEALQRQYDLLESYRQYAEFNRQLAVDKEISSMVSNGELTDNDMRILRSNGSQKSKEDYLMRLYNKGQITKETLKNIYNLGDLTKDNEFTYGLTKTGKIEDMITFGMNEIARSVDITEIANRYKEGKPVTQEELGVLDMYSKLSEIKEKAAGEDGFGTWFNAGTGLQQSLRFVVEAALTGGVGGVGKQLGVKGTAALIQRYGLKRASQMIGGRVLQRAGKSALKQAALTPASPSAYVNYADRVLNLTMSQDDVTLGDKLLELKRAYVDTFTERFSESLGDLVGDVQWWTLLNKGKATKDITNRVMRTLAQVKDNPFFSESAEILGNVGITGIPGEVFSELSGNIMNAILNTDMEQLKAFTDRDFYAQVAITSLFMGGMGGATNYIAGGVGAIVQSNESKKKYEEAMARMRANRFSNPQFEALRQELEQAMYRQEYITQDVSTGNRGVADIMADMNEVFTSLPMPKTKEEFAKQMSDATAFNITDNAVRMGAYRYGEVQAIKSYLESKIGEFEHEDGNVYELTDNKGKQYFVLDNSDEAVVLIDRATGEKTVKPRAIYDTGTIKQTNGNDWAVETLLINAKQWNAETPQTGANVTSNTFIPAVRLDIDGNIVDVKSYDPATGKYTIADENGNTTEFDRNDPRVKEIFPIQDSTPVKQSEDGTSEEDLSDLEEDNAKNIQEVTPIEKGSEKGENTPEIQKQDEIEYGEDGDPIWSKISTERAKQEIDNAFKGNEDRAKGFVSDKIKSAQKAVDKAVKKEPKATTLRAIQTEMEQIEAEQKAAAETLAYWQSVEQLYNVKPVEEAPVNETEQTTEAPPVVDDVRDNPADARARGFRSVEGVRYDRQQPMQTENLGGDVEVKFAEGVSVKGKRGVIEANEAQPSHINGTRNPRFFLNEAQPKDRTDKVSDTRADRIAKNIRPEEITGGVTAYTGSPVVNTRREAIQGNGRLDALKRMYQNYPEQAAIYKQYLVDHAAEWGLDPNAIAAMEAPILVDVLDVTDEQAIQLGQRTAQDIESGGEQKISAQNVAQTLGKDMKSLANILLKTEDEDADINDVISENGYEALKWLVAKKVITETQLQTALNEKGDLTIEAREALKDVLSQIIFQGGNNNIRKQFGKLPKAAQKAILQTISRELDNTEDNGILSDIQEAIEIYSSLMNDPDFKKAKTSEDLMAAALSWAKQIQMDFTEGNFVPEDRYSNFAIALAVTFKANTMKQQSAMLNQLYDYIQAEGGDIFNPAIKLSKAEAVKQVYGVELKEKQNEKGRSGLLEANDGEGSTGGQGSTTDVGVPGQDKQNVEQTDNSGASGESDGGTSTVEQIDVDTLKAEQVLAETAKAAVDLQKGADAVAFVENKVAQAEKALNYANKLASMASTEADIERVANMITDAQKDLKFWTDVLNLYNLSNENTNGTSGQSNTEVSQETPNSEAETANQTGQTEQENPQGDGNQSNDSEARADEGHSRLGELKTEVQQRGLRRQGIQLENAYDNILGSGNKLWKVWADRNNQVSYALLTQLKQAQKEARENNGWVSDETFIKVYSRIYKHSGSDIVLNAMKGNTGPSSKTLIPKDSILGKRGIESGVHYGLDTLVSLYNDYNIKDEEIDALAEKVFSVAKNLGIGVIFSAKKFGKGVAGYSVNTNTISLNTKYFNSDDFHKERKGDLKKTALHEVIHAVTAYALEKKNAHKLTPEMKQAVNELNAVYNALAKDRKFFTFYGSTNVKEMVAEMANPKFREYLKSRGMFKRIIGAISKFFISSENQNTNAFTEINNALNKLLDSFNEELYNEYNGISNVETQEDIVESSIIPDGELKDKLQKEIDNGEYITLYRAARKINGKYYSPKMSKLGGVGQEIVLGQLEQSDERPDLAYPVQMKDGSIKYKVNLDGGDPANSGLKKRNTNGVDYNPYIHASDSMMNDQFTAAFDMPEMVVLEVRVPKSELTSGYKADKAAESVGQKPWKSGAVDGKLPKNEQRKVYLTRYDMPVREVSTDEIADHIAAKLLKNNLSMPYNLVTPQVAEALLKRGVDVSEVPSGKVPAGQNEKFAELKDRILKENNLINSNTEIGRTAEQKQALFDKAKEVFGTTNNFKVAGYMLPDGSLLDFSGRWEGGPGDARYTDHRAIGSGLYEASETDSNYDTNMYDFINQGAIRLMPESAGIYVSQPLTKKQEDRLASYIYRNNGEVILEITDKDGNSISYIEYNRRTSPDKVLSDINNYFEKGIEPVQPEVRFRLADGPMGARQHSEEVMRESIDKMAQDLGVNAEYISDEKQLDKKGWYDPATGKVYVNLAAHATIDDARATYLHEIVGHFGLRGLLKDKFEKVMNDVFNSLPKDVQADLLKKYKNDKEVAAEEYLASMIENDIEPSLVEKILGFIREALRSIGINLNHYTNGDLEYLLWRSKNNLRENAGHVEAAQWGAKNKEARYRSIGRPAGYSTNNIEMSWFDRQLFNIQDRMRPVKILMDEIINRGGQIDGNSDPHSQEFLSGSRADAAIQRFKSEKYEPLAQAISEAIKVLIEKNNMLSEDARIAVDNFLYARHALERNKKICTDEIEKFVLSKVNTVISTLRNEWVLNEINNRFQGQDISQIPYGEVEKLKEEAARLYNEGVLLDQSIKDIIRQLSENAYDIQFAGATSNVSVNNLNSEQQQFINALVPIAERKVKAISKQTAKNEETGETVVIANNRSGMSDEQAREILNDVYTAETKAALDEVSAKVKDCTNFTLDKWKEYGLISSEEYDTYKNQYEYYIPLRGWEDTEDIDYTELPSKQFNMASKLINMNTHAKGRWDKAKNPLAYIASLAMSACITGERNLIRQQAFNMVAQNEDLIADLAVIENTYEIYDDQGNIIGYSKVAPSQKLFDQGRVKVMKDKSYNWNKTKSQLGAHRVPVMIDGVRHIMYFKGKIGAQAAIAINGTGNDTRNVVIQQMAKYTRWISSNLTAKNAYFIVKNTIRDLMFGNFAYFVENGYGRGWKLNTHFASALRTAFNDAKGKMPNPNDAKDVAMYNLYQEFKENGGQTGYIQLENIEALGREMDRLIKEAGKNRGVVAQGAVNTKDFLVNTFDALGRASENAMRFAVYRLERESGASPREAAIKAKNITVNFNQQGKNTKYFSAMYAFFNPAIQGTMRFIDLGVKHPARFITALGTMFAFKVASSLLCEFVSGGDDEEEGKTAYDRLSDYVKATNYVIPLGQWTEDGEDKFLCIPIAQSARGPISAADKIVEVMMGKKDVGEAAKEFFMFNLGEFMPFDIDAVDIAGDKPVQSVVQAMSPTTVRPIVEAYVVNRDFMGNPVSKEPFIKSQDYKPEHSMAFATTSPFLVGTSKVLNELAGGDDIRSAGVQIAENGTVSESAWNTLDLNPARFEHMLSGYFGGMAEVFIDTYNFAMGVAKEDADVRTESVPIVNQLLKEPTNKPGYKAFYKMVDEAELIKGQWSNYKGVYGLDNSLYTNEYNVAVVGLYNKYVEGIRKLNKQLLMTEDNEKKKELEKVRDSIVKEAANEFNKLEKK